MSTERNYGGCLGSIQDNILNSSTVPAHCRGIYRILRLTVLHPALQASTTLNQRKVIKLPPHSIYITGFIRVRHSIMVRCFEVEEDSGARVMQGQLLVRTRDRPSSATLSTTPSPFARKTHPNTLGITSQSSVVVNISKLGGRLMSQLAISSSHPKALRRLSFHRAGTSVYAAIDPCQQVLPSNDASSSWTATKRGCEPWLGTNVTYLP
jgi:hypothetical protein